HQDARSRSHCQSLTHLHVCSPRVSPLGSQGFFESRGHKAHEKYAGQRTRVSRKVNKKRQVLVSVTSMSPSASQVVPSLVALGFSLNESRAYAALLSESPATGYEVGVRAQIPRSAVYGVLRRLVKAGAVRAIAGAPERFVPAAPDDLLSMLRKRFDAQAETL